MTLQEEGGEKIMEIIITGTKAEIGDFIDFFRIMEKDSCYKIKSIGEFLQHPDYVGIYSCYITFATF